MAAQTKVTIDSMVFYILLLLLDVNMMVAMVKAIVAMMTVTVMIIMIDGVVNGGVVLMVEWC